MNKLMYERGNLYTGDPFAVQVEKPFGSTEVHGPFSGENEAWNYGMDLARKSDGTQDFRIVRIKLTGVRTIATAQEIRNHREHDEALTKALGIGPGETLRIDIEEEGA